MTYPLRQFLLVLPFLFSVTITHAQSRPVKGSADTHVVDLSPLGEPLAGDPNDNKVYTYVEQMPELPGGKPALDKFIADHVRYPAGKAKPTKGSVFVRFTVTKEGRVTDPVILKSLGDAFDAEALRVISLLPRFSPGRQNGYPMNVSITVVVPFRPK